MMTTSTPRPMAGKVVLVTGANSGIGVWTARGLAALGAQIVTVCRDPARGKAARDELASIATLAPALLLADLSVQDSIRNLAAEVRSSDRPWARRRAADGRRDLLAGASSTQGWQVRNRRPPCAR